MTPPWIEHLDEDAVDGIAALCRRSMPDPPVESEIRGSLFAADQPAVVRGDPSRGVVAVVECDDGAHVRLLVVDPDHRGRGRGHELVDAAEHLARVAGHTSLTTGADAPYYLWPGVPSDRLNLVCLFERHKYARVEMNFNMDVDLVGIPPDPGGWEVADRGRRDEVDEWATRHWSNWRSECLRALDQGTLVISRDDDGIAAVCAYDVNRSGFVGPVAVRPDRLGRGAGIGPLIGALHLIRLAGARCTEISWVGPVVPYARVGATIGRVFPVYRKLL